MDPITLDPPVKFPPVPPAPRVVSPPKPAAAAPIPVDPPAPAATPPAPKTGEGRKLLVVAAAAVSLAAGVAGVRYFGGAAGLPDPNPTGDPTPAALPPVKDEKVAPPTAAAAKTDPPPAGRPAAPRDWPGSPAAPPAVPPAVPPYVKPEPIGPGFWEGLAEDLVWQAHFARPGGFGGQRAPAAPPPGGPGPVAAALPPSSGVDLPSYPPSAAPPSAPATLPPLPDVIAGLGAGAAPPPTEVVPTGGAFPVPVPQPVMPAGGPEVPKPGDGSKPPAAPVKLPDLPTGPGGPPPEKKDGTAGGAVPAPVPAPVAVPMGPPGDTKLPAPAALPPAGLPPAPPPGGLIPQAAPPAAGPLPQVNGTNTPPPAPVVPSALPDTPPAKPPAAEAPAAAPPPAPPGFGAPAAEVKPDPKPAERPPQTSYDEDVYEAKAGDRYEGVSREFYNDPRFAAALAAYNRNRPLGAGARVDVPPVHVLKKRFPQLLGGAAPAGARAGLPPAAGDGPAAAADPFRASRPRAYTAPPGGTTMWAVAREVLGDAQRWDEIYRLNPKYDTDRVPAGAVLQLPAAARPGE